MADDELTEAISLRLATKDKARLDALSAALPLKTLAIARIALRLGMAEIERDPGAIFRDASKVGG